MDLYTFIFITAAALALFAIGTYYGIASVFAGVLFLFTGLVLFTDKVTLTYTFLYENKTIVNGTVVNVTPEIIEHSVEFFPYPISYLLPFVYTLLGLYCLFIAFVGHSGEEYGEHLRFRRA